MVPIPVARRVMTPAAVRATFRLHVKIGILRCSSAAWAQQVIRSGRPRRTIASFVARAQAGPSGTRYPVGRPRILRTCDVGGKRYGRTGLRRRRADPRGRGRAGPAQGARGDRKDHIASPGDRLRRRRRRVVPRSRARGRRQPGCPGGRRRLPPIVDQPAPSRRRGRSRSRSPTWPPWARPRPGARQPSAHPRARASRTCSRSSGGSARPPSRRDARVAGGDVSAIDGPLVIDIAVGGTLARR